MEEKAAYEKMGLFYLGRQRGFDGSDGEAMPMLLKSKQLTTHGTIIGMTGSGKTGLGIALLEEAIMDDIPCLIIDPKGDMANLLLTFPELRAEDFAPWVDAEEAERKGMTADQMAAEKAQLWRNGLLEWGQPADRIARLREKTTFTVYTPGSRAGTSVSILEGFAPPSEDVMLDGETLNSLVDSAVISLLSLVDIGDVSSSSREYVLLSAIFLFSWRAGKKLDMETIIGSIASPPFDKIGVFSLDTYYPQWERMKLAFALNGMLASPGFTSWLEGEPLDIGSMLRDEEGKPRTAIFSIAHLDDSKRMFFVTMLLGRLIDWMRRQQGASSLKTLLYMDEIFGFFPPSANPPSKKPMLLLLKQARAYGVGVVLATQNPVDLDYRGLSNIGTWWVGRLQTRQDQDRVLEGMASGSKGVDKALLRKILDNLQSRHFLLSSAHLEDPMLFQTRWVMSYLKGPLSGADIGKLHAGHETKRPEDMAVSPVPSHADQSGETLGHSPVMSQKVLQLYHLHPVTTETYTFEAWLLARASVRFFNAKRNIDEVKMVNLKLFVDTNCHEPEWSRAEEFGYAAEELLSKPPYGARYCPVPLSIAAMKDERHLQKSLGDYLYRNEALDLYHAEGLGLESDPGESLSAFRMRISDLLVERREEERQALEEKYKKTEQRIEEQLIRAMEKVEKEKGDVTARKTDTLLSFGTAILGAFFGRKSLSISSMSRASTGIKNVGRLSRDKEDVKHAEEMVDRLREEIDQLAALLEKETAEIAERLKAENFPIETFAIKPRRRDIFDVNVSILWEMVL